MYSVYILFSEKMNRFYTGSTSDLEERLKFHRNSTSDKFTGKANDWEVFLNITCDSKAEALAIESHIKKMKSAIYIKNLKKYPKMVFNLKQKYT